MADAKIKITSLPSGTPQETDVIPFVDLITNTTKKALKSELKGIQGDPATATAGTTTTLDAGQSATVTNVGTTSDAIFNFAIPQGIQGLTGANGACVVSVSFVGNNMVFVLDDASTVTLTNAKVDLKGDTGAKIVSGAFVGNDLVFTLDDSSTATVVGASTFLKGVKGDQGIQGIQGIQGVAGINGTNGTDGTDGTDGIDGISYIWKGTYSAGTSYSANDCVTYNGTSYIYINVTPGSGHTPADDTYWDILALKGNDGVGSGDISGSGTANELAYFTAEKTIDNLAVATYPSLTEVSYVKGVTSSIQTQINGKQATGSYEVTTNKENTTLDTSTTKYPTNRLVKEYADGKVEDNITDGHTTIAPSGNAVFDALALKINNSLVDAKGDIITATADNTPAKLTVGDNGKVLTANSSTATGLEWTTPSAGGASLWTAITGTRASNTTITVATDQTAIFKKGMIVRWQESGVDKVGMVSIPSTYSSPNTTITIIGDVCASIDTGTFKYSVLLGSEPYIKVFPVAGNIGATGTDISRAYYANEPMRVIGTEIEVGSVASTSGNTVVDINKGGTTMFTTKPTIAYNALTVATPFTADTATSLALGDRVSIDIDTVTSTTFPQDLYVSLYLFPTRFLTLS